MSSSVSSKRELPPQEGGRVFITDRYQIGISISSDSKPFPSFSKPLIVGCFSLLKANRYFTEGPAALKFCHTPSNLNVHWDLARHVSAHPDIFPAESDEEKQLQETSELIHLLHWIHSHEERRPHFVFYRGLMSKLLGTPYENQDGWKIAAMVKNGTIYIRNLETTDSKVKRQKFNASRHYRTSQWGRAFEHFALASDPLKPADPSKPKSDECNIVFYSRLGNHDLLYAAEIDGVLTEPGNDINPKRQPDLLVKCPMVELKTTRQFPNGAMPHNFKKYQLRKWWCQCFTVGVSDILVGLRDDEGVIHELQQLTLSDLSKLATDWCPTVCFNFLDSLLTAIKKAVGNDDSSVYVFEFKPERRVQRSVTLSVEVESQSDKMLQGTL